MLIGGIIAALFLFALIFYVNWENTSLLRAIEETFDNLVNWALFCLVFIFFCIGFFVGNKFSLIEIKEFKSISVKPVDKQTLEVLPNLPIKEIEDEKAYLPIYEVYIPFNIKDNDEEKTYLHTIQIKLKK